MGFGAGSGGGNNAISGASDVALNSVSNAQLLQYNTSTSKWQNGAAASRLVETVNTVASSGTAVTIPDTDVATIHNITLTANSTFTFPSAVAGKSFTIRITHGSSGFNINWPSSVDWPNGVTPTLTGTAGKRDVFTFACMANGEWMGFIAGLNY